MDKRRELTRRLLADSFKALLLRHPFDKISILMITNEAGIRRPSFYNHFQDKYDLLEWIVSSEVVSQAEAPLRAGDARKTLHALFTALMENAAFYRKAFTVTGQNGFEESFIRSMHDLFRRCVSIPAPENSALLTPEIVAGFHAVCFVSVVKGWLETGPSAGSDALVDAYLYLITHSIWQDRTP